MLSMFARTLAQASPNARQLGAVTSQRGFMTGVRLQPAMCLPMRPVASVAVVSPMNHARYTTLALNNLYPYPGRKSKRRVGRGCGSGHGKTSGRGTKGQNARGGIKGMNLFEGGQTPFWRKVPKSGFSNRYHQKVYAYINLSKLQMFINQGRLDSSKPITMKELLEARLVKKCRDGIKLLGQGELTSKIDIEVSRASKSAIAKVEAQGGRIVCGYYNRLALRALTRPEWFAKKGRLIPRRAKPPPKMIEYYLNYANRGYLSTEVQLDTLLRRQAARKEAEEAGLLKPLPPVQPPTGRLTADTM
jgi:large subunit ribosomal protein L15